MRYLLALTLMVPALAQQPEPQTKPDEKAAQAPAPAETKTANPAPSGEQWLAGEIDFGYRWLTDIRGNFQEYRSVVNLGEGPKLTGLDFTIQDPKKRLFDRLDARAAGWGGDPYNTAHLGARKQGIYDFNFDYSNITYFDAVPSFANPNAPSGINEQMFDLHRRNFGLDLDLMPGKRFIPYLAFERNSGYGHGVNTWVQDANDEFAVPLLLRDSTDNYRGGVRIEFNRFHATLEEGGTTFKDDDQTYYAGASNPGNRTAPLFGQPLVLNSVQDAYGIRGHSVYSRVLATASPASWINLSGQFLYSEPKTTANYSELATGNFALVNVLTFYGAQYGLGSGSAVQPHVTANGGMELRPLRRVRIVESVMTDRYHDAAYGLLNEQFLQSLAKPVTVGSDVTALNPLQVVNYNQQQTDVLVDVTSRITVRGGYRRVWGDASVLAGQFSQSGTVAAGQLRRNVGLAGFNYRASDKLSVNLDYEGASSDQVYFRTSLNNYHRARARARYQATNSLSLQANFRVLENQNPSPAIRYDFQSRDNSLAAYWTPGGGKRISVMAEYDRSTLNSDITYLALFLAPTISAYHERAHTANAAVDVVIPRIPDAKVTVGGSLFTGSGTRPTSYYQPLARLSLPLHKHVYWNTTWQYYGFGEQTYLFEGFRTHVFMTGLRLTR